jgi:sRNA-binding carbon storage regulator CsrA
MDAVVIGVEEGGRVVIGNDPDPAKNVVVTVVAFGRNRVRLGVTAPAEQRVLRSELLERPGGSN